MAPRKAFLVVALLAAGTVLAQDDEVATMILKLENGNAREQGEAVARLRILSIGASTAPSARTDRAIPQLVALIRKDTAKEPDESRREAEQARDLAAITLGLVGKAAVPPLCDLLKANDPKLRAYAAIGFENLASDPEHRRESDQVLHGPEQDAFDAWRLEAFRQACTDALPLLTKALKDASPVVRRGAARALVQFQGEARVALPGLYDGLRDADDGVRFASLLAVASIGTEAKGSFDPLTRALADRSRDVAAEALFTMGRTGRNAAKAVPMLVGVVATEKDGPVQRLVRMSTETGGRELAVDALTEIARDLGEGPDLDKIVDALLSASANDKLPLQPDAKKLAHMGAAAMPHLTKTLADTKAKGRAVAAVALGQIMVEGYPVLPGFRVDLASDPARQALRALRAALTDNDFRVREAASGVMKIGRLADAP